MRIFTTISFSMSNKIKFGTDGWRAIIADDFTVANVARVAKGTADWIHQNAKNKSVVVGYDCRFGGFLFAETAVKVLLSQGIQVYFDPQFVSTPMISFAAFKFQTPLGVIITASHNPPAYNGFKLKAIHGGPASPAVIEEVENLIPDTFDVPNMDMNSAISAGSLIKTSFEDLYFDHVSQCFDLKKIENSGIKFAYDAMFGAGQRIIKRLLPTATLLHASYNPSFMGTAPEPIHKNLTELANLIINDGGYSIGIANDGDADRIGLYDANGKFIDAHHIILVLIHILYKYKGLKGKVVVAFSVSPKIKKLCEAYGLEIEITKIGFKYISEIMVQGGVLLGGEESGGIAVAGHIPERDGIWDALIILEHLANTGLTINQLIKEVYEVVGPFAYDRLDLHLSEEKKQSIISKCPDYKIFGDFEVEQTETIDGFKYHLNHDSVVMIRPSGTEPLLRVYGEAPDAATVQQVLEMTRLTLME